MKLKKPEVSIIMSVHNGEEFINDSIKSILNQSFKNFEFLIFDDGSTDSSLKKIKSFKDKRIKVYAYEKNKGLAFRLNEGIKLAQGKFIARMDDDDLSHPERILRQVNFLKKK